MHLQQQHSLLVMTPSNMLKAAAGKVFYMKDAHYTQIEDKQLKRVEQLKIVSFINQNKRTLKAFINLAQSHTRRGFVFWLHTPDCKVPNEQQCVADS